MVEVTADTFISADQTRLDKETHVNELSVTRRGGQVRAGWEGTQMVHPPRSKQAGHPLHQADILAKLRYKNYARSSAISARLCENEQAMIAWEQEDKKSRRFWLDVQFYYNETWDGNLTQTEEDEVIEVTTEEQLRARYSSFDNIEQFLTVSNARRKIF